MRYWTRWVHLKYEIGRKAHRVFLWFIWRLPKSIAYWSAIRVGAHATTGEYGNTIVPELAYMDALKRWETK